MITKNKMELKNFIKTNKKKLIIAGVILILVLILKPSKDEADIKTEPALFSDLRQEVSLTGTVESKDIAELAFESSGKVTNIFVEENQLVKKGQRLITLNSADLSARRAQNQARYEAEVSRLEESNRLLDVEKNKLIEMQSGA